MEAWRIAPESLDSYCTNPVADHVYLVAIGDFVYPPRETQERNDLSTSGMEFDSTQSSDMNSQEAFDQDVHKNSVESVATESKIEEAAMAPEVASTKEEFQRQPEQMDPTPVTQEPIATEQIASRDDTPPPSQDSEIRQSPPEVRRPVIREVSTGDIIAIPLHHEFNVIVFTVPRACRSYEWRSKDVLRSLRSSIYKHGDCGEGSLRGAKTHLASR